MGNIALSHNIKRLFLLHNPQRNEDYTSMWKFVIDTKVEMLGKTEKQRGWNELLDRKSGVSLFSII